MIDPKAEELGWTISKDDDENLIRFITPKFSGADLAENPKVISATKEPYWKPHGGLEELEALVDLWKNSFNEGEQYPALECLGRPTNAELVKWVLSYLLTDAVKNHGMFYLTWLAGGTAQGSIELWEWAQENLERIEKEVLVDIASLFLGTALEGLHTQEQIEDVKAFFCRARYEESPYGP
ncbi:uncharacterized protein FFMR_02338 [Fusarium fujikuroi]|nr:uncharacterized protein FFMR_02338 [Fusarium fujikuroi]